jgi:hypothetical protein
MTRIAAALATAATVLAVAASSATASPVPRCHWTHHTANGVHVYTQVCTIAKQRHHKVAARWTHAGPGNSPPPRIG